MDATEIGHLYQENIELRVMRFAILTDPPQFDRSETTDKGYINQGAILNNHADLVEQLYEESPPSHVIHI